MKFFKKSTGILLIFLAFAWNLVGQDFNNFKANDANVKILGRTFYNNDVLWMGYSNTGAEFEITAHELEVTIVSDTGAARDKGSASRIVIFVDGQRTIDEMLLEKEHTYCVFNYKGGAHTHNVRVIKVSEATSSWAGIKNIKTDSKGTIKPLPQKELKIEFIGDSITCGYGIDDLDRNHHFATSTEDSSKTYAYKTAEMLDADYSMVSISGWGVVSGYTSSASQKQSSSVLPKVYEKVGMNWSSVGGKSPKTMNWDFSKFTPDVIVINLGTNDNSYCNGNQKKCLEFQTAYENFIKQIRKNNPDAYIICSLGMMGTNLYSNIVQAVNNVNDPKVTYLQLNTITSSDGYAADWHPTEKTNIKAANILTEKIESLIK